MYMCTQLQYRSRVRRGGGRKRRVLYRSSQTTAIMRKVGRREVSALVLQFILGQRVSGS